MPFFYYIAAASTTCVPGGPLTRIPLIILSKPMPAVPHNRHRKNGRWLKKNESCRNVSSPIAQSVVPPGWLSGERVGLMTWWLRVRSPVEATFLSGVFSPLTSAEACAKSSRWLWKEK